jgi:hypothetical protein
MSIAVCLCKCIRKVYLETVNYYCKTYFFLPLEIISCILQVLFLKEIKIFFSIMARIKKKRKNLDGIKELFKK